MKILIVSDTHNSHKNLKKVLETEHGIDLLIHLGDTEGGEKYIESLAGCPSHILAGNNDFCCRNPREKEFVLEGHHVFLTHGHTYMVALGEERLKRVAKEKGADIVMYGHTHRPSLTRDEGLLILNPGSIAYPRQPGRRATYMVMELEKGKEAQVELCYV